MKWEYMLEMHDQADLNQLNRRGDDGWELCGVVTAKGSTQFIYKRQRPQHP
jgi:hypothetical protein